MELEFEIRWEDGKLVNDIEEYRMTGTLIDSKR